jgi:hypothetical protein
VAEVFYDGGYHYFDSDMLGYNPVGPGPLKQRRISSVHDIEKDGGIILGKLAGPKQVDFTKVDQPWYPADVRANAIPDLTELFTSTNDNWVFPFTRYASGHSMDFTLRPGERVTRYFRPQDDRLYYLPFAFDGEAWREFPKELEQYRIRTRNGPQSQKDSRRWGTGMIEYRPPVPDHGEFAVDMPCPWVIIDAAFSMNLKLRAGGNILLETSIDGGKTWKPAATLNGPHEGPWRVGAATVAQTANGRRSEVTGMYGYQVRIRRSDAEITDLLLTTSFQINPRTLPQLTAGRNQMQFRSSQTLRTQYPVHLDSLNRYASKMVNAEYVEERGQGWVRNRGNEPGVVVFKLQSTDGSPLSSFDVGGRFLDLRGGLAPDKLTAEVRKVTSWPDNVLQRPSASLAWSLKPDGPWKTLWSYDPTPVWLDGEVIDRTLRWPEVQRNVESLPADTRLVYVRYEFNGIAIDDFRLAYVKSGLQAKSSVRVTHIWNENGTERRFTQDIGRGEISKKYIVDVAEGRTIENRALLIEAK